MSRRKKDLAAMAAFAATMYGLNEAKKVDRSLGKMKSPPVEAKSDGLSPERKAYWAETTRGDKEKNDAWWAAQKQREAAYDKKPDSDAPERSTDKLVESATTIPLDSGNAEVSKPKMARGGAVKSSASKRADGIAQRGKTKGRMV
jgi:hypothetical protein